MRRDAESPRLFSDGAVAFAIFLVALVTRLLFLSTAVDRDWPHSMYYEGDAPTWVEWASALSEGREFEHGLPIRSPGVAYVLHWMGSGRPYDFAATKALWCVLSAATCGIAYLCFVRGAGRRAALLAAAMCAFSFGSYVTATSLNNEAIYTFVLVVVIWLTMRLLARPGWTPVIAAGAANGAATLLRAEHSLLLLMLAAFIAHRFWWDQLAIRPFRSRAGRTLAPTAVVVLVSAAICLPWSVIGSRAADRMNRELEITVPFETAQPPWTDDARGFLASLPAFVRAPTFIQITREARAAGMSPLTAERVRQLLAQNYGYVPEPLPTMIFVSAQGPLSFALANHPQSDGGFTKAALVAPGLENPTLMLQYPPHLRLVNRGYGVGFGYIRDDPGRWVRLVGEKLRRFANGIALGFTARNLPIGLSGVRQPVDMLTPLPGDAVVWEAIFIGGVLAGVIVAAVRRTGGVWTLVIGYKLIVTVLFYGYARQAVSILPAFYLFAAIFVDQLIRWMESRHSVPLKWQRIAFGVIVAALIGIEAYSSQHVLATRIDGPHEITQAKWGSGSFESALRIELHALPPRGQ